MFFNPDNIVEGFTNPKISGKVYEVRPEIGRDAWLYVLEDSGAVSEDGNVLSFVFYSDVQDRKVVELLFELSNVVRELDIHAWYYHTISDLKRLSGTDYSALAFLPTFLEDEKYVKKMKELRRFYLWVYPLTSEEQEFAEKEGTRALEDRLVEEGGDIFRSL